MVDGELEGSRGGGGEGRGGGGGGGDDEGGVGGGRVVCATVADVHEEVRRMARMAGWLDGWMDGRRRMGVRVRRGAGTSSRNEEERTRSGPPKKKGIVKLTCSLGGSGSLAPGSLASQPFLCSFVPPALIHISSVTLETDL